MAPSPVARDRASIALLCLLATLVGCGDGGSGDGNADNAGTSVVAIETVAGGFNIGDVGDGDLPATACRTAYR